MSQSSAIYREEIEQVRRRFAEFRAAHAVMSRLPEALWAAAAKLAKRLVWLETICPLAQAWPIDIKRPSRGLDSIAPLVIQNESKDPHLVGR